MDWYFESDIEDLTVPKDEEMLDRLPSFHSWSSWGNMIGKFNAQEKRSAFGVEELTLSGTMFFNSVDQHSPPNIFQDSRHTSSQCSTRPHEYSDIELDDLPIMDDADDIFLYSVTSNLKVLAFIDSLFEVDARVLDKAESSANSRQTSREDYLMTADDLLGEKNHIGDGIYDVENVRHFLPEKEQGVLEELSNAYVDTGEEYINNEESALLELQSLTAQMAKKTRIGFRDSFYRLAENSRYRTECSWDMGNRKPSTNDGPSWLSESRAQNPDTNAIDRTVATLLFDTTKFYDLTSGSTPGVDFAEKFQREYQENAHLYHPNSSVLSLSAIQEGDAEVPTLGLANQTPLLWS